MPGRCPGTGRAKMERSEEGSGERGGCRCGSESAAESGGEERSLDSQLWHACAGGMVQLPRVGSKVIYFPQGHAEHAASPPEFPPSLGLNSSSSAIPCRVMCVKFLADTETDEVYARIRLEPAEEMGAADLATDDSPPLPEKPASFAKTLTQSDANNGGGFSVPRYCAETIFPRLDYSMDPPVQTVLAKDVHGVVWKFRHIYRGTPRRHLLTTGWSSFVNQKKLVAGDAIVFLRSASGELCVGVRRSNRGTTSGDSSIWHLSGVGSATVPTHRPSRWEVKGPDFFGGGDCGVSAVGLNRMVRPGGASNNSSNFSRNRPRVTAKSVLEAATLAAAGQSFQVVYYPRATISEFCIQARAVKASLQQNWGPGMRFKMAIETEDSSRISWFMGTISKVQEADPVLWPNSPWKMLQITWDEPDLLQGITRVSPWQVELVSPMQLPPFSLPKKKMRVSQPPELHFDGHGIMGLTMATLANNVLGHMNPWNGFSDNIPAGMQGARHDRNYGRSVKEFWPSNIQPSLFLDSFYKQRDRAGIGGARVSTELNMNNFTTLDRPSVQNKLSAFLTVGNSSHNQQEASNGNGLGWDVSSDTKKSASFVLFGKAIETAQTVKSQKPQHSGGSSSEGPRNDSVSDGHQSDVLYKKHSFLGQGNGSKAVDLKVLEASSLQFQQGETLGSTFSGIGSLQRLKELASNGNRTDDNCSTHCKVFRESEEVGRTIDLSLFNSYEELYERLARMFAVEESEIINRMVYMDCEGSPKHVGDEQYRDFVKRSRRLKILSESSSESMTR